MDSKQKQYYRDMCNKERGYLFVKNDHLVAVLTFFIGNSESRYLRRIPWTVIDDNPEGETVYIDQLLVKDHTGHGCIHREFKQFLKWIKEKFPNVKRAKWVRVNAAFRKHGLKEGVKSNVHTKNIE